MTNQFPNYVPVQDLPVAGKGISQIQNYVPIQDLPAGQIAIVTTLIDEIGT